MQNANDVVTELVLKFKKLFGLSIVRVITVIFACVFIVSLPLVRGTKKPDSCVTNNTNVLAFRLVKNCIKLERAQTPQQLIQGLSGRSSLGNIDGMLFVFMQADKHCMWMKEMQFDLDMVWLNENGEVVELKQHVSKNSYPTLLCNAIPAKYVIEFGAGKTEHFGIQIGQHLPLK